MGNARSFFATLHIIAGKWPLGLQALSVELPVRSLNPRVGPCMLYACVLMHLYVQGRCGLRSLDNVGQNSASRLRLVWGGGGGVVSQKFSSYRAWQTTHELARQKSRFGFYSEVGVGFF